MLTVFQNLVVFPIIAFSQFLSYDAIRMRVPGRCMLGDYDCGLGQCVPISQFRDGKPDCMDGSDEWCFIGQVSCGPVYCADYKDALPCIVYPKCDGSSKQLPWCSASKEKLCADKSSFPCKGYGECVLWEWLLDGKKDCIDGSDEDENYVMPLEHAYRCARNQSGLFLPKPIPPPPEDHPSLHVEGCSMCSKLSIAPVPSNSVSTTAVVEHTTPKYPFMPSELLENAQAPLINVPLFPEESKPGEFFPPPSGVEISPVTGLHKPTEPIGDFFPSHLSTMPPPTHLSTVSTHSHTFRPVIISTIRVTEMPQAPLVFPERPDLPPITAPPPLSNNWPIPIATTTQSSHHEGPFPPITHPAIEKGSEMIPPIKPEIVISRPLTSRKPDIPSEYDFEKGEHGMGVQKGVQPGTNPFDVFIKPHVTPITHSVFGVLTTAAPVEFRPVTSSIDGRSGNSEFIPSPRVSPPGFTRIPDDQSDIQHEIGDILIPLIPGRVLPTPPTRRPLIIPSFFTSSPSPYQQSVQFVTRKPQVIGQGAVLPTLIPQLEIEKYVQTEVPPSSVIENPEMGFTTSGTQVPTNVLKGIIEENTTPTILPNNAKTMETESHIVSETTTPKTTSQSKIIHVGPGTIDEIVSATSQTKPEVEDSHLITGGTDKVIHIGPTVTTTQHHSTSTIDSTTSSSTFESTSPSSASTTTLKTDNSKVDECLQKMSDSSDSVVCDCPNGQFRNIATGKCEETLSLLNVKIKVNQICDTDRVSYEQKQRVLQQKLGQRYKSCIHPTNHDPDLIATVQCDECSLQEINSILTTRSFGEPGILNVTAEALGSDLCSYSELNHCHTYSDCVVDSEGLRYACRCKKGTKDTSAGYGRQCEGFPEESDCIMVLGICLIVWLIFLLGAFILSLLSCIACYSLCRNRCCRQITIYPADSNGLQTVVVGSKATKNLETNSSRDKLPHMRNIFAESLKHSAKGSSSVASAFALADFKRKKVSLPPEMSQVTEDANENSSVTHSVSIPKISSLAKISTHTANSEPPTPVGIIETPILQKNSSSVSLVSANDNAPQLPSLPLPLPVPITTSATTTNLEETTGKENVPDGGGNATQEHQVPETERPASSHSIGVQPTIWETYRVLGQQYSKSHLTERKRSVDSLEQMFDARLAETARVIKTSPTAETTDKSSISAVTFSPEPQKDETEKSASAPEEKTIALLKEPAFDKPPGGTEDIQKNLNEQQESRLNINTKPTDTTDETSFSVSEAELTFQSNSREAALKNSHEARETESEDFSTSLGKSLEAALLIEMAKRGIELELPLSPKASTSSAGELRSISETQQSIVDTTENSDVKPVTSIPHTPKKTTRREPSAKSIASSRKSMIPSAIQSRESSAKQRKHQIDEKDNKQEVFVPHGAKTILEKGRTLRRSSRCGAGELVSSTDESDPEVAFFKRIEKMKKDPRCYPINPYARRRKPERTLSSISEKSAEIAAEAALEYPQDTSISCPPTTRAFLDPKISMAPRYVFKRKVIEATEETSDVDIPKHQPERSTLPIVNSPEIPDVTIQRSIENLHKTDMKLPSYPQTPVKKSSLVRKKSIKNESVGSVPGTSSVQSSQQSSKFASKVTTPRTGDETPASFTSRSTRHSVISRKIAIRRQELKAVSGSTHDINESRTCHTIPSHILRGAKSAGDVSNQHSHWGAGTHKQTRGSPHFLPPITPSRNIRTAANSPQRRHCRSDSHFSMASLPLISHSPVSFWSSPHFNPSEDSRKPPKEDLWWSPNKRV